MLFLKFIEYSPVTTIMSLKDNICVVYYKNFYLDDEADEIFQLLQNELIYNTDEQSQVVMMGKKINIPRKQVAYGDDGVSYNFTGTNVKAKSWNTTTKLSKCLKQIRDKVSKRFNCEFNFVLINKYADGNSYIGPHYDDERDLVKDSPIVGVSFGESRLLNLTQQNNKKEKNLLVSHGSAFAICYPTNKFWKHSIPKSNTCLPRISLTFRLMTS